MIKLAVAQAAAPVARGGDDGTEGFAALTGNLKRARKAKTLSVPVLRYAKEVA